MGLWTQNSTHLVKLQTDSHGWYSNIIVAGQGREAAIYDCPYIA